jgi:hypothetical protein
MAERWGHGPSEHTEHWFGAFSSREAAVEDVRAEYGDQAFWVTRGTCSPAAKYLPRPEHILEQMAEAAGEDAGEAADEFPEVSPAGRLALRDALEQWARQHVAVRFWVAEGVPEKVEVNGG